MLGVSNVTKVFERDGVAFTALAEVTFELAEGEFCTLIGPSGCGKTTLLRIVGGLARPTTGTVSLDGRESLGPSREKAFVFQHFNLLPWRTVLENAEYGLEMQGVAREERRQRTRELIGLFGLGGFEGHYPSEISGGMRQRVGIARALLLRPKVLLMDEPFGALDAVTRELMQEELLGLVKRERFSVLFVTHSVDEAIVLSDRIFAMSTRPGRIARVFESGLRHEADGLGAIRAHPSFGALRDEIWKIVRAGAEVRG